MRLSTTIFNIPLPHLGIGFDQDGNKIDLTVTGGVTESFDKNGSKWLHEKGCVKTGIFEWDGLSDNGYINLNSLDLALSRPNDPQLKTTSWLKVEGLKSIRITNGNRANWQYRDKNDSIFASNENSFQLIPDDAVKARVYWMNGYKEGDIPTFEVEYNLVPNNQLKEEVVKGISVPSTGFLNTSPFEIDFSSSPFFDKSNPLIWKQIIRDSIYYDKDNPFIWNQKELNQKQFYENVFDDYKYLFWLNIKGNKYLEMFFYKEALDAKDICHLKKLCKSR